MEQLPYTQKLIGYVNTNIATPKGFYLGTVREIVPCYNAMMLEAYTRLGLWNSPEAQSALQWIKCYQFFARNEKTAWPHDGICRHGGCLGSTPCYIGIGKTVRALITYAEFLPHADAQVEGLITRGTACFSME